MSLFDRNDVPVVLTVSGQKLARIPPAQRDKLRVTEVVHDPDPERALYNVEYRLAQEEPEPGKQAKQRARRDKFQGPRRG